MTPQRKQNLSIQLGLAYLEAENQVEKNILKDCAQRMNCDKQIRETEEESLFEKLSEIFKP